jgi:hypothetical protein
MNSQPIFIDVESIRRQQMEAAARTHGTMVKVAHEVPLGSLPAASCELLGLMLRNLLEGCGVRFADSDAAAEKISVALFGGLATAVSQEEMADEESDGQPVYGFLAPVYNAIGAVADSIISDEPSLLPAHVRADYLELLKDEQAADD